MKIFLRSMGVACTLVFLLAGMAMAYEGMVAPTGVLKWTKDKAYEGYTLFSPYSGCKTTYLIDMEGNVVHKWETEYAPGFHSMLLPNGNLLMGGQYKKSPAAIGGSGGIIQEIDWDGKVVWEYVMYSPTMVQHHTFWRMPNGNTLLLAWEFKSVEDAIAKGRDPETIPTAIFNRGVWHKGFWVDFVREVDKNKKTVWEWHAWDHLGKGPAKLDINYILPPATGLLYGDFDWSHFNTVSYIPETDQVLLNSRNLSEFYLVNHKTGDIEYRWGNPSAYGEGKAPSFYDNGDQKVFGSHCAVWIGKNHVLLFDNGSERPEGNRSAAVEVDITTGKIVWEYEAKHSTSFYSYRQGSVQRLPNGNTLICSTQNAHIFEVTKDKEVVWDFLNPINRGKAYCFMEDGDGHNRSNAAMHRAYRYGPDYPGLKGKDLSKKEPLAPGCPEFGKIYGTVK